MTKNFPSRKVINSILSSAVDDAWGQYEEYSSFPFVVRPSIPILFFGNYFRYVTSSIKVITVGLNPSYFEFPSAQPFCRFPQALTWKEGGVMQEEYIQTLSSYYHIEPYMRWFSCYEPILNGMACSYFDTRDNTALHTDICSPLATDPTWSSLSDSKKEAIARRGSVLWHDLVAALEPDVIILSVAKRYLKKIQIPFIETWRSVYVIERSRPFDVQIAKVVLPGGKESVLVFGKAAQTPFGTVSRVDKAKIGKMLLTRIYAK